MQSLLHSINGGKLLKSSSPPQRPVGSHVLDLSAFRGTANLDFQTNSGAVPRLQALQSQSLFTAPSRQREVLGGDLLTDLMSRDRNHHRDTPRPVSAVSLLGNSPTTSVRLDQLSDEALLSNLLQSDRTNINNFLGDNNRRGKQTQLLTNEEIQQLMRSSPLDDLSVQSTFSEVENLKPSPLSFSSPTSFSSAGLRSDQIFAGEGRDEKQAVATRQVGAAFLGGRLDTSVITDEVVSKVMEHLRLNQPEFQIPPVAPPPPPPPPALLQPGPLGGVLVPPADPNIINDHFPLPKNPLPPHHHHRRPQPSNQHLHHHTLHHATIQDIVNLHKPQPLHYNPKEELHVKHNPEPHDVHHPAKPVHHPEPVITKTEISAPPGCKAYSTKTCKKTPIAVPEKVPVPKCYDVPKVECFHVLSPAPDLACAPKAVEDCMNTVKEVPYLAQEESCYEKPKEVCRDITEQVTLPQNGN